MGTSSSSPGPGNKSPLFPNWDPQGDNPLPRDENENQDSNNNGNDGEENQDNSSDSNGKDTTSETANRPQLTGNWGHVKASLGRIANSRNGHSFKGFARKYVGNVGGVKNAVRSSRSGVSSGSTYAGFLSSISLKGFTETLRIYGLSDCIGKSADEVFVKISDKICPTGDTNEEAISRKAILDSLSSLYEKFVDNGNVTLDNLSEADLIASITEFTGFYIYHKWLYELGLAIENKNITEAEALGLEEEMKEFIFGEIRIELQGRDVMNLDFASGEGKELIKNIFEQSYSTLIS